MKSDTKYCTINTSDIAHRAWQSCSSYLCQRASLCCCAAPQIAGVVFPLLRYATTLGSQESECLVDEAFRLWSCTLSAVPEVSSRRGEWRAWPGWSPGVGSRSVGLAERPRWCRMLMSTA